MDAAFPFGFPLATGFYLFFYVFTLTIHVLFMNYVLAGTLYLVLSELRGRQTAMAPRSPMAGILRDWMPAMLSGAITAGVAPLLFIQILYQDAFYTSNLLLLHRWMSILPVLIVGFYLLYLLRADRLANAPVLWRGVMAVLAFGGFVHVALAWTENHLLGLQDAEAHAVFFAQGATRYAGPDVWPRLLLWTSGAIPTMALLLSWQLWYAQRRHSIGAGTVRRTGALIVFGLLLAAICGYWLYGSADAVVRDAIHSPMARPYWISAGVAMLLLGLSGLVTWRTGRFRTGLLIAGSIGCVVTVFSISVIREAVRIAHMDVAALAPVHEKALRVGGLPVFLAFFVINAVLVAWCFVLVRRGMQLPSNEATA